MIGDKQLIFDGEKCTGCRVCEMACAQTKQGEFHPRLSYIRILRNSELAVNIAVLDIRCDFCNRCVESCLPEAIKIVESDAAAIIRKSGKIGIFPVPVVGKI